jgi:hypothetical protein
MGDLKLSAEQLAFMLKNHEQIEQAIIETKKGNYQPLDDLIASAEFQSLLGAMGWDDAYDRYQDMPEYDNTLTLQLNEQLTRDIIAGKVQIPASKPRTSKHSTPDADTNLNILRKLTKDKVK